MGKYLPSINKIVKVLILYDFLIYSSWGLVAPIFAIFVLRNIENGTAQVVGIAVGIYWALKGILQIPIGKYLDKKATRRTNINFIIIGTSIASLAPAGYYFAALPWHLYVLGAVQAVGLAMAVPPWGGVFMRHVDKGKESETWSMESSLLGIGMGLAGFLGGVFVSGTGFKILFIVIFIFHLSAVGLIILLRDKIIGEKKHPAARPLPIKKPTRHAI